MLVLRYVAAIVLGYLSGSFPTGYLVSRVLKGVDPRQHFSGRTGGTNVLRSAGRVPALLTVIGDGLKGALAVLLARWLVGTEVAVVLAGLAAVLGHNRSVFLGFHGGAGAMTNAGVALALVPHVVPFVALAAFVAALSTHTASLVSIASAVTMIATFMVFYLLRLSPLSYVVYSALSFALILFELRPNLARLRAGSERKVDKY
jgi:glycerol-3-phosphate acyltransferase PlsY